MITKTCFNVRAVVCLALMACTTMNVQAMDRNKKAWKILKKITNSFEDAKDASQLSIPAIAGLLSELNPDLSLAKEEAIETFLLEGSHLEDKEDATLPLLTQALDTTVAHDAVCQKLCTLGLQQHEVLLVLDALEIGNKIVAQKLNNPETAKNPVLRQNLTLMQRLFSQVNGCFESALPNLPRSSRVSLWSCVSMPGKIGVCAVTGLAIYGTSQLVKNLLHRSKSAIKRS